MYVIIVLKITISTLTTRICFVNSFFQAKTFNKLFVICVIICFLFNVVLESERFGKYITCMYIFLSSLLIYVVCKLKFIEMTAERR